MITSISQVRPEILAIAMLMEQRLRDHDEDKGSSWKNMAAFDIATHASAKAMLLHSAIRNGSVFQLRHAIDLANYSMMAADVMSGLVPQMEALRMARQNIPADCSVSAIEFALKTDDGLAFLNCWLHGEFPEIRKGWPDAPEAIFIGADPLHPETKLEGGAA